MIREVENSFIDFPGNNCFACHPNNNHGLKLKFYANDDTGEVFTKVKPETHFNGFPGILHGGIQCALVDEVAYWAMFDQIKKIGLTAKINIDYISPVPIDVELEVTAKVTEVQKRRVTVDTVIRGNSSEVFTKAEVLYFLPNKKMVFKVFGEESFNEKFLSYIME
ncbi:MAG: PaaI family thioesterase [Thermodesulfobacteriota bacterium]